MSPSQNAMALIRAFDLNMPPAKDKESFRLQSQLFLDAVAPYTAAVASLLAGSDPRSLTTQNRFDALLSVAYDVGIEVLVDSALPGLLGRCVPKSAVSAAFLSIPAFEDTLRDELQEQMQCYRLPLLPRRHFELELFNGNVYFTIGRTRERDGSIVYAPSVLHPMYRFLMVSASSRR